MVMSLLLQPYLKEAVARLPWGICDMAKVKAEVCQDLREVLERHRLPNAVHDHYDYRHLQLPEKLAYYAFRELANMEVFPDAPPRVNGERITSSLSALVNAVVLIQRLNRTRLSKLDEVASPPVNAVSAAASRLSLGDIPKMQSGRGITME
jgi:hypothetical protein